MTQVYLDHAATTPLHPAVLEAMLPFLQGKYGNPSSIHAFGREARAAILSARDAIARHLGCRPRELIFTSGGTESDNLAIIGAIKASAKHRPHVITAQIEHHAVLATCRHLQENGVDVTYVPVDRTGIINPDDVGQAIRPETALISIMYVNNEVGTLQPIAEIGRIARSKQIPFHVDAVQALGVIPIDLSTLPVDLMSFSAHKINGPKGVGALYVGEDTPISPLLRGGKQEHELRAGTENVAGIAGFAEAVKICARNLPEKQLLLKELRQSFLEELRHHLQGSFVVNGHAVESSAHILNVSFPGTSAETMLMNLDLAGIAASSGSACTAGSLEPSHVLAAMRLEPELLESAIRFSFGLGNTKEQILDAAQKTATIANRLRNNR
ncbi:MAG TPA: cysteine desulfurase family protein [Bacilli bacterium]